MYALLVVLSCARVRACPTKKKQDALWRLGAQVRVDEVHGRQAHVDAPAAERVEQLAQRALLREELDLAGAVEQQVGAGCALTRIVRGLRGRGRSLV